MILQWFNFFKDCVEDAVLWLSSAEITGVGRVLAVIVAVSVSFVIVKTFLSRGNS